MSQQSGPINPNLVDTSTPPIPAARAWLQDYAGQVGPPINLSQAVPGTPPPDELLARLGSAAARGDTASYGPITGDDALVAAYAEETSARYGTQITRDEIAITCGCNEAFFVTALALAKAGETVMLPAPWYFNHEMTLRMLGIKPLLLPAHAARGFVPDPAEAAEILNAHRRRQPYNPVRAIVLVTPNNPTGANYPAETIAAFGALAEAQKCWLVLDETYRDFMPSETHAPHSLFEQPAARRRLIQLYSFSKAYAVPGHRVGALIAPAVAMAEITKVLDCMQICAPRAAQSALAWAIPALRDWRRAAAHALDRRADRFRTGLLQAPGWRIEAIGAYFAYLRHPYQGRPAVDVAQMLASRYGLLALPGSYFGPGQDDFLRFAFANVDDATAANVGARLAIAAPGFTPTSQA